MQIVSIDRTRDGLLIVFGDGFTAIYPTDVLYALLPTLDKVVDGREEELEEE